MSKSALCIGINDYPGTDNDLAGCDNDALDWKKALVARDFAVTTVLDAKANGAAIRRAVRALLEPAANGDTVVIQYSGHGTYVPDENGDEPDGTDECWCPHDLMSNGPITDDELFELFSAREAGVRLVIISDSCHSGTVARFATSTPENGAGRKRAFERKVRFLPPATFLSRRDVAKLGTLRGIRASSPPGRYAGLLMAGCQDTEYSYDAVFDDRPNGAFTFVALRELNTLPADATYKTWFDRIRSVLPSAQYPQRPNLFGTASMKTWSVFA